MSAEMNGKSVLVTGAGGFIGSHLTEALVHAGARVRALVHYNSRSDLGHLESLDLRVREALEVMAGDLRDPFYVAEAAKGVEVIFHLGALIPIPYSYRAPQEYVDTNIRGTLNVLEAARRHDTSRVLHTSTSETYGTGLSTPIAQKLAESYWCSFGTPVVTVRPFNTYGPRQSARAFLPTVLSQALTLEVVRVWSLRPVAGTN